MTRDEQGKGLLPILILVVVAVILAVLFVSKANLANPSTSPAPATANPQNQAVVAVMLDPAVATVSANQDLTFNVKVDTKAETVTAVELHLSYDPAYLDATSIKEGPFLAVVLSPGKLSSGTAVIAVGASPVNPQNGTGNIAVVKFKAKKAGQTTVMVDKSTQVAAIGRSGSVLGSTSGTSVTIK